MTLAQIKGVIRDPIHGFIPYTYTENELMQSPFLRRLHGVKQLGLSNLVFPGATHTRFSHSIGTMHVSSLFAERILRQTTIPSNCSLFYTNCGETPQRLFYEIARLTGLLHDLGHLPFSHQLEESFKIVVERAKWAGRVDEKKIIPERVLKEISAVLERSERRGLVHNGLKLHELFTQVFIEKLRESTRDDRVRDELCVVRGVLNPYYREARECVDRLFLTFKAVRVLRDIISHDIADADRLDYLERDGFMTGVVYGRIDTPRLLQGVDLTIIENVPRIVITQRGLSSLEDIFDARYKMYKNVYHHHKVKAINIALTRATEFLLALWDEVLPAHLYRLLESPSVLFDPETISDLINSGRFYFTDNDFISLFSILANIDGSSEFRSAARRWARSILERRDLLPVSLLKRPDELHARIASRLAGLSSEDVTEITDTIIKNIINMRNELKDIIYRYLLKLDNTIDEDDVIVEFDQVRIFEKERFERLRIYHSLYLKALASVSSVRLLFAYVMSDSERVHKLLYSERVGLRKIFIDFLRDSIENEIKK